MTHLPRAVPYPEHYAPKRKPAIDGEVVHKQLAEVLEHRASKSATTPALESTPNSSCGTAPGHTNVESDVPSPSKDSQFENTPHNLPRETKARKIDDRPPPTLVSASFLRDVPGSHKPTTSQAQDVPVYPMNKQNIKPHEVWVNTKGVPLKYYSFAFLTQDQAEYVKALQDNWDNTSAPPIRPEAPVGTTLHKALNSHCLQTMERVPPGQAWKTSNNDCLKLTKTWEATLSKKKCEPGSPEAIERDSNIQRCRELREELLSQRSNVEEMVSTKILLARAVWQQEAFKQFEKERARVVELEAELVKAKDENLAAQKALLDEVQKQQEKSDVHDFNAFTRDLDNESRENALLLYDWQKINQEICDPSQQPGNPMKLTRTFGMFPRFVDYMEKRRLVLEQEKASLSKLVDVRPFRNDKANLIGVTLETVVHDTLNVKADCETRLQALKDRLACWSPISSPGLSDMPLPPPDAAAYGPESQEDLQKLIERVEAEKQNKEYEWAVALSLSRYWKIYCPYKTAQGHAMDLSDEEEEYDVDDDEQEYEDDSDYEEDPCAKLTEAKVAIAAEDGTSFVSLPKSPANITNIENPSGLSTARTMQWLYDVITHACQSWTEDVVRHRNALQKRERENDGYQKTLSAVNEQLKRTNFQNIQFGKLNQELRTQVKELETRISEYISFMQKLGLKSDKDLESEECIYNSVQSLKALRDENVRSKAFIDGLNERVAELTRALGLYQEAMVPCPSTTRLEESLAGSLQSYDDMHANHSAWLKNLNAVKEDSSLGEEVSDQVAGSQKSAAASANTDGVGDDNDDGEAFTDSFSLLGALAEGKSIPGLEALMAGSRQTSPERRKPPGSDDEHALKRPEIGEAVNVEVKEGRNTKFIERFEEVADEVEKSFTLDIEERGVDRE
ncbi:hypothetical protein BLS_008265 [Venturia inaequalis]|uniref:Uncharacterized protein n=1 Tax=Venturia inaequalis TaxID=5025 RepID=A0A8H3U7D9_VENIN|nr:hypothetical protein BLS_008265 [Venturia inaequalis]KAE9973964.1 hypothetical protein EG328_004087 [Venturia inaequalis]KAE9989430.1 hypothetical protein EG327_002699 [Venturia inaequalis]RDI76478.1 hypothetical protein Vi05172_g13529 [Venturia inaequalis]